MNTNNSVLNTRSLLSTAKTLPHSIELLGRVFLVTMYLISGLGKLSAYDQTAGYMEAYGLPSVLLPLVIGFEILASVAIIIGWKVREVSFLLAGFTLVSALVFHTDFADQMQMVMFLKNLSIAGAFLLLFVNGPGKFSLDARKRSL